MLKIDQYFGEVIGKSLMANGLFFASRCSKRLNTVYSE